MSDSESADEGPTPAKLKRHSYSVKLKLEALEYAKTASINAASKKFKVLLCHCRVIYYSPLDILNR